MAFSLNNSISRRVFSKHFAEEVVYRPHKGSPRRIKAIVDRQPKVPILEGRPVPFAIIEIDNSPVTGVTRAELDEGLDRIELPVEEGGPMESRDIGAIVYSDAGRIGLEVR